MIFAALAKSSAAMCALEPFPDEPNTSPAGLPLAKVMTSDKFCAGSLALMYNKLGAVPINNNGASELG